MDELFCFSDPKAMQIWQGVGVTTKTKSIFQGWHILYLFQFVNVFPFGGKCKEIPWKMFWNLIRRQFENISLALCTCEYEHIGNLHGDVRALPLVLGSSAWDLCTPIFWQNSSVPLLHNWALWVMSVQCIHRKKTWYFKFSSLPLGGSRILNTNRCFLHLQSWTSSR